VQRQEQELFLAISVDPLANLDRVEQVLVMVGFVPGLSVGSGGAR